jgi:GNAT superfamily N-acetyltransferase
MNNGLDFYIDVDFDGDTDDFDCGFEIFNAYLKNRFLDDRAVIHYVISAADDNIIAYFSFLASCIFLSGSADSNIIPAIELKMFALDKRYHGLNLSENLLDAIYKTAYQYSLKYVGAKALILYSVPAEKVVKMYESSGFRKMPENFSMYESSFNDGCIPMYRFLD